MYTFEFRPFENEAFNTIECMNEFCLVLLSYVMVGLSDFNQDLEMKITLGFCHIGVMATCIVYNTAYINYSNVYLPIKNKSCKSKKGKDETKREVE